MMDVLERLARVGKPRIGSIEYQGETFFLRGMAPMQRTVFLQCVQKAALENSAVPDHTVVALGLCTETGESVGTSEEVLKIIDPLDGELIYRMATKVLELSGFSTKAVEQAEKN